MKDVQYAQIQVVPIVYKDTRIRMATARLSAIDIVVFALRLIIARFVI